MDISQQQFWKKCSSCKREIGFQTAYYLCSVSTCKHKRTGFRFCSVPCWDAHLGYANHRDAWAEEERSPSRTEYEAEMRESEPGGGGAQPREPVRKIVNSTATSAPFTGPSSPSSVTGTGKQIKVETLVVVSRVKDLVRDQSEFNASQCFIDALTQKVVTECLNAIEKAKVAGRKTVMGRDVR